MPAQSLQFSFRYICKKSEKVSWKTKFSTRTFIQTSLQRKTRKQYEIAKKIVEIVLMVRRFSSIWFDTGDYHCILPRRFFSSRVAFNALIAIYLGQTAAFGIAVIFWAGAKK